MLFQIFKIVIISPVLSQFLLDKSWFKNYLINYLQYILQTTNNLFSYQINLSPLRHL